MISDLSYDYFHQQLQNKFSHWMCIGIQFFYDLAFHLKIALHSTQFGGKKNVSHHTRVYEKYGLTTTSLSLTPCLVDLNVPVNLT